MDSFRAESRARRPNSLFDDFRTWSRQAKLVVAAVLIAGLLPADRAPAQPASDPERFLLEDPTEETYCWWGFSGELQECMPVQVRSAAHVWQVGDNWAVFEFLPHGARQYIQIFGPSAKPVLRKQVDGPVDLEMGHGPRGELVLCGARECDTVLAKSSQERFEPVVVLPDCWAPRYRDSGEVICLGGFSPPGVVKRSTPGGRMSLSEIPFGLSGIDQFEVLSHSEFVVRRAEKLFVVRSDGYEDLESQY